MSLYCTYQVVETPLNQNLEPLIRIRKADLEQDPVRNRMLLILGFVFAAIVTFALLLAPTGATVSESSPPPLANEGASNGQSGGAMALAPVFSPEVRHWERAILHWSERHSLDPDIVATIMQIESCGDPEAVSRAGAMGLFQVMPFHFEPGEDRFDPDTNAHRGLSYYSQQLRETGNDIFRSFAGYNGGSAASSSSWDYWAEETQRYYIWSKGIYEEAKAGLEVSPTLQRWMQAGGASLCRQAATRLGIG